MKTEEKPTLLAKLKAAGASVKGAGASAKATCCAKAACVKGWVMSKLPKKAEETVVEKKGVGRARFFMGAVAAMNMGYGARGGKRAPACAQNAIGAPRRRPTDRRSVDATAVPSALSQGSPR